MTISLSMNVPSLMAMTLGMVSMIAPADAQTSSTIFKMTISLSKNVPSLMAMTLGMVSMIAPVDAQTVICSSTSPQCCWVKRSWQLMGKTTDVSHNSATACCYYLVSLTGKITYQTSGIPGVNCTSTGIVTNIQWSLLELKGSIPAELAKLVNLQTLILAGNQLNGSIPPSFGDLVNLQWLGLIDNSLNGSIPHQLGKLTNLKELRLSNNKLSGSIPVDLGNLRNLQTIFLNSNKLSGSIPHQLGNLVNLQTLFLYENQLSGSIPHQLGNLVNLQWLFLGRNQLSGSIPYSLGNLVKLQDLRLINNTGLNGTFTTRPEVVIMILGTNVTICGGAAANNPPGSYPSPKTSAECLASISALTLAKRAQPQSLVIAEIGSKKFTCHTDSYQNPYADCLNSMAVLCNPANWNSLSTKKMCRDAVDEMFGQMNTYWKDVRKECGRWLTKNGKSSTIVPLPAKCNVANANLRENAFYKVWNSYTKSYESIEVDSSITVSINDGLWSKVTA